MLYLLLAVLVVAADRYVKYWVVHSIELGGEMAAVPKIFKLTYVQNKGAAFSMMSSDSMRWVFIGLTAVCAVIIVVFIFKTRMNWIAKLSAGAVLGGALGNAIDRAFQGYVIDMIEVEFMDFAIFNVADCFIVCGCIAFCIYYIYYSVNEEKRIKAQKADAGENGDTVVDHGN